jgi:hypothetical protein
MQYSYKVFLIPKPANHESSADLAVEFIKYDANNPEEMARINRVVALIKPTAAANQVPGRITTGAEGFPVRIVTDENATAVRAIDYDLTHPYRQMDLLKRLRELLPRGVSVSTYDLTAVRYSFDIFKRDDYYHKSRFGSGQYSDSYALWIAQGYVIDGEFFINARAKYYEDHH